MHLYFLALISLFAAASAAPSPFLQPRSLPLPPSQDDFYNPPSGYESKPLGTILKSRKVDQTFGVVVIPEKIHAVYQYLVRSEDSSNQPNAIVTTLFVPTNADPSKLVSYQPAEDSTYINCAPSYAMRLGADPKGILTSQIEQTLAQAPLNAGYYVNIPDYEGPKSSFGAAHQAGYALLNSLKAVLSDGATTGLNKDAKVAVWGYSGGTIPSTWGASFAPTYAPDINIVGVAAGGAVLNVSSFIAANLGTYSAGLFLGILSGLSHEFSDFSNYIYANLYPQKVDLFKSVEKNCLITYTLPNIFTQFKDWFPQGLGILTAPPIKAGLLKSDLAASGLVPKAPVFLYNTIADEIVPSVASDVWYKTACAAGATVTYHQDLLGGHITESILGAGDAFSWIKDRLNGIQVLGCTKKTVLNNALTPSGLAGLGDIIAGSLTTYLLQLPVGIFA